MGGGCRLVAARSGWRTTCGNPCPAPRKSPLDRVDGKEERYMDHADSSISAPTRSRRQRTAGRRVSPRWLTAALRAGGSLPRGFVQDVEVEANPFGAFNSEV